MAARSPSDRQRLPPAEIQARFATPAGVLLQSAGVSLSAMQGFGRGGLLIGSKLFAMPHRDGLLKLSAPYVAALIASGDGVPFDAGRGRPMREWVVVTMRSQHDWLTLARQALAFVSGGNALGR